MKIMMSKLDKLKMPEKKPMMNESADAEEGSPEEEANESPEEEAQEQDEGKGDASDELKMVSDDDLMAEMKKRGLMAKMMNNPDDESQHPQDDGMV
jgi:hypothetical protein